MEERKSRKGKKPRKGRWPRMEGGGGEEVMDGRKEGRKKVSKYGRMLMRLRGYKKELRFVNKYEEIMSW